MIKERNQVMTVVAKIDAQFWEFRPNQKDLYLKIIKPTDKK